MKNKLLLSLIVSLFAVSAAWADTSVVERFSQVGVILNNDVSKTEIRTVNGDLCQWEHRGNRRDTTTDGFSDKMASGKLGWWTSGGNSGNLLRTKDAFEGGVKHIDLEWKQSTTSVGSTVKVDVIVGGTTFQQINYTGVDGSADVATTDQIASIDCNITQNAQICVTNSSVTNEDNAKKGRVLIGDITITPYILYQPHCKHITLGLKQKGFKNYLIDNTEGEGIITYSSSDESKATVDEDGFITPKGKGTTTITATWGSCTTFYSLTIIGGDVMVENFSKIGPKTAQLATEETWEGDFGLSWKTRYVSRNWSDTLQGVQPRQLGTMFSRTSESNAAYLEATYNEGGVKHLRFEAKQWGASTGKIDIRAYYAAGAGALGNAVATYAPNVGSAGSAYTFDVDIDDGGKGNGRLRIKNNSSKYAESNDKARIVIPNIQITPWLLYTTKNVEWDRTIDDNESITNTDLIDNTGATITYTISDNSIEAVVNGDGVVTATGGGNVTVTASWEQVNTSYNLHIKANTTASFTNPVVNKNITEIAFTIAVNKTPNMAVANYTSSNENVAIVDENTGTVTIRGVGQTTITATIAEDENYGGSSASYILRVTDNSTTNAVVEAFSAVPNGNAEAHAGLLWDGDVYDWRVSACGGVRKHNDTFASDQTRKGIWMGTPDPNTNYSSLTVENGVEGGIKHIWFYCEQPSGTGETNYTLKPVVYLDEAIEANKVAAIEIVGTSGEESIAANRTLFGASNVTKANSVLIIRNESYKTSDGSRPTIDPGRGRFLLDEIHITPWLLYTTKNVEWDRTTDDTPSITNNALINNKTGEDPITYSISENEIEAEVDGTGVVTATGGGNVRVTASWEEVSTWYDLHIIANTTASYEHDAIQIAYGAAVSNSLTRTLGYNGTIAYESSNPSVAEVDEEGNVTVRYIGETTITATLPETDNYSAAQASYTLSVLPNDRHLETFDNITSATANYSTTEINRTGVECNWYALYGGFNPGVNNNTAVDHNCARFKAPYTDVDIVPSITSAPIPGGISKLSFKCKAGGNESSTTWNIRVLVNETLIETLTDCPTSDGQGWKAYTIENINVAGDFVLKFENRSTVSGEYKSTTRDANNKALNKGRLLIDDIQWIGLTALANEGTTNTAIIGEIDKEVHSVQLADRTIRTGGYNTLCLPFDVSEEQLQATLPGAKAYEFTNAYLSKTNLDIRFDKRTALEAGKPYLVTVPADVANPVFESVTIDASSAAKNTIEGENMRFIGSFNAGDMNETGLYVVANNLYRVASASDQTIGACRAYFDVLAGEPALGPVRMRIVAGTNTATDIEMVNGEGTNGRKVLREGVLYIERNGRIYNAQGQIVR